jgi:hypothetical protein
MRARLLYDLTENDKREGTGSAHPNVFSFALRSTMLKLLGFYLLFIDGEVAASFDLQIAPVALIADQTLVPTPQLLS